MTNHVSSEPELTRRQREVLDLVVKGHSNQEIADALGISLAGAKWHVSELIGRFGVTTREEVAAAWESRGRTRRWAWLGLLGGLGTAKIAIGGAAAAVVVGGAVVAAAVTLSGSDDAPPVATGAATATPSPSPPATPEPFTEKEAVRRGLEALQRLIGGVEFMGLEVNLLDPLDVQSLALVEVRLFRRVARLEMEDGDRYWLSEGQLERDVWLIRWEIADVQTNIESGPIADLSLELLLEDATANRLARGYILTNAAGEQVSAGFGGFFSRTTDAVRERIQQMSEPVWVAWLNGIPGGRSIGLYSTQSGSWCIAGIDANGVQEDGGGCAEPVVTRCMSMGTVGDSSPGGGAFGRFILAPSVALVRVRTDSGKSVEVVPQPAPEGVNTNARFAYAGFSDFPTSIGAVASDADGNVLATAGMGSEELDAASPFATCE